MAAAVALALASSILPVGPASRPAEAATLPAGFTESVVWSGLTNPTVIQFAPDGRVFVAEKSGIIKVFDSLADSTPTAFADLRTNVHNFWDRGLLGMVLDPAFPVAPYVYVLYTYDHVLGDPAGAPRWGTAGATSDGCPFPPGATSDGCVVSARLSRLTMGAGGTATAPEQVLIEDWCQQFPSHSIGTLAFGPEGALYASAGDGASFNTADYGQLGGTQSGTPTPVNPCGDTPGTVGTALTVPSAEGGALRSQDLRTVGATGAGDDYRATVLGDAPVAYWRLGESTGSTAVELVAGRNGTYAGGVVQGSTGGLVNDADLAASFDGVDDRVTIPDADVFSLTRTGELTLEFWAQPVTDSGGGGNIIAKGTVGNYEYAVDRDGNGFHAIVWTAPGNVRTSLWTPSDYDANRWHHVVVTMDDGVALRIHVDGALAASSATWTLASTNGTSPLEIGRRPDAADPYVGGVDEVAVYDRLLTAAEIAEHYQVGTTGAATVAADPVTLDGTLIRIDPATGLGWPGNPFSGPDDNARRVVAYGMRNPFRFTFRPGTTEVWLGDVGAGSWEEIDRVTSPAAPAENFGWPCYEGVGRQSSFDGLNLTMCENLYAEGTGAVVSPYFTYNHSAKVVSGETCPTGSSAVAGLAFYPGSGGPYPAAYAGALFFLDNSRDCIWAMRRGSNGLPDTGQIETFVAAAANPVDLKVGPDGRLYYVDFDGGTVRRIDYAGASNQPPTAVVTATPTSGDAPLAVQFDGSGSTDPEGGPLTYAWDLDGDGQLNDASGATAQWTYTAPGTVTAVLRVTDPAGAAATTAVPITIGAANERPVPVITAPALDLRWAADDIVAFAGSATDAEDGALDPADLSWSLTLQHCPSNCHTHLIQTWDGVAAGSFTAPDHEYPAYLELSLTATDSSGATATVTQRLDPATVVLSFASQPSGLMLTVDSAAQATPFTRTVIANSAHTIAATSPQSLDGATYAWASWSDGGSRVHTITAPSTAAAYSATFQQTTRVLTSSADAEIRSRKADTNYGSASTMRVRVGRDEWRSYVSFVVSGLTSTPTNARLRLFVSDASSAAASVYRISNTSWTESGITWSNAPPLPGTAVGTIDVSTAGAWAEVDLGALVTGNGTYSFAVAGGSSNIATFHTREGANSPQLVLDLP